LTCRPSCTSFNDIGRNRSRRLSNLCSKTVPKAESPKPKAQSQEPEAQRAPYATLLDAVGGFMSVGLRRLSWVAVVLAIGATSASAQVRIVQTNSAGDNIHLIDPSSNTIVGEIKGVPINHGAAADPDGRRFYISSEAEQTLHVVDGKTLQTTKKIPLTGRPNNISIAKDGSRVYVGIVSAPGAVDVIDTKTLERVKSI